FITTLPAPSSTLFPYTTLFRSVREIERPRDRRDVRDVEEMPRGECRIVDEREEVAVVIGKRVIVREVDEAAQSYVRLFLQIELQDRKSTRLNSSHVAISYAVFC